MQFGKAAREDHVRTWLTLAPGLRVRIIEANQTGILIKLHPQGYVHPISLPIALGDLKVNGCDVMPTIRIRASGGECLKLSNANATAARVVDASVWQSKRIGATIPIAREGQICRLTKEKLKLGLTNQSGIRIRQEKLIAQARAEDAEGINAVAVPIAYYWRRNFARGPEARGHDVYGRVVIRQSESAVTRAPEDTDRIDPVAVPVASHRLIARQAEVERNGRACVIGISDLKSSIVEDADGVNAIPVPITGYR